jgi:hypothetical protein
MDGLKIMSNIGFAILLINILLYLIGFSGNKKSYKVFVIYLFSIVVIQSIMDYYVSKSLNNHFLSNYYLVFQFVLLSIFYYFLFKKVNKKSAKIVLFSSLLVTLGLGIQYLVHTDLYFTFNSKGFLVTSIVLIVYSVLYFYEQLTKALFFYYVNVGVFLYLISSSLIFATATSFISFGNQMNEYVWQLNAILFIVYQLLILWEWWKSFYPKKIELA